MCFIDQKRGLIDVIMVLVGREGVMGRNKAT